MLTVIKQWLAKLALLVLFTSSAIASEITYAITMGMPVKESLACTYAVMGYPMTSIKYRKGAAPSVLFKASLPKFKNEGVPTLNLGDVALIGNKICILHGSKKNFGELELMVIQCLDRFLYGEVALTDFVIAPPKWNLYQRDTTPHELTVENDGMSFMFPQSPLPDPNATPPWNGYFLYLNRGRPAPIGATSLNFEFKIEADQSVVWNFRSDATNVGCDYSKPSLRIYIAKGQVYAPDIHHRWWYTPGFVLQSTLNVVVFTAPLDGMGWDGIYAGHATDDPVGFQETLAGADWIGLTFGGGCAYSHGVNTSFGSAKFTLSKVYYK